MTKVTIIGAGNVGATIAYTMAMRGLAQEIVLIDINDTKAFGEAMDIKQGTPFVLPCEIYNGTYADAIGSDLVVFTSGVPRKPGQSRLDLAQTNVDITLSIIPQITHYAPDAVYIVVANPVDILTYTFTKYSGLPENKVFGSGTILDTSRLRTVISEVFSINQQNVHAHVFGEHGDTAFVPWSLANISGIPVNDYRNAVLHMSPNSQDLKKDEILEYVHKSGAQVIKSKGATFFAVSASVCYIAESLFKGIDTTMTVSTMLHGEYGIEDVCLSMINVVGKGGVKSKIVLPMNDNEVEALRASANSLKSVIAGINFNK